MPDFLLEIGTEEIPSGMLPGLIAGLSEKIESLLCSERLPFEVILPFGGPRRIGVLVQDLPSRQEDRTETVAGPPIQIARDPQGWTQAALGFARKQDVDAGKLREIAGPRGPCVGFDREVRGKPTAEILSAGLPACIESLYLPKTMRWGSGDKSFVRPVRWVVSLLDDSLVPVSLKGIQSGKVGRGHRSHGSQSVPIPSVKDYFLAMRRERVIPDPVERRRLIQEQLDERARERGGQWRASAASEELLEKVTFLCEYPTVIAGGIPDRFTSLPPSILSTCLREHQNFFTLHASSGAGISGEGEDDSPALPVFLSVIDAPGDPKGFVRTGNENVSVSRLADAEFFYRHDREVPLEHRLEELRGIVYHPKLGSYHEKARRMEKYARSLAPAWGADPAKAARAALLCKCDLASLLVQEKEFTSLQGIAGGLYAAAQGEDAEVVMAIREHYRPTSPADRIPGAGKSDSKVAPVVALSDKLDMLLEFFKLGLAPTGSKDPFALRRAATGIVRILMDQGLPDRKGADLDLGGWVTQNGPAVARDLLAFLSERARALWEGEFAYDEINAILAGGLSHLWDMDARLRALHLVRNEFPGDFDALSVAFKRSKNILKGLPEYDLDPARFLPEGDREGGGERGLWAALEGVRAEAEPLLYGRLYADALRALAAIRPAVDRFFDDVLVMCDPDGLDPFKTSLQKNRLALLQRLVSLFDRVADFALIVPRNPAK